MQTLQEKLKVAQNKTEVRDIYNDELKKHFKQARFRLEVNNSNTFIACGLRLKLIIEYKFNTEFKEPKEAAKVFLQVLYYLQNLRKHTLQNFPNVLMCADIDEILIANISEFLPFLNERLDSNFSPSNAYKSPKNAEILKKLEHIKNFVFDMRQGFDFKEVVKLINDVSMNASESSWILGTIVKDKSLDKETKQLNKHLKKIGNKIRKTRKKHPINYDRKLKNGYFFYEFYTCITKFYLLTLQQYKREATIMVDFNDDEKHKEVLQDIKTSIKALKKLLKIYKCDDLQANDEELINIRKEAFKLFTSKHFEYLWY